MNKKYRVVKDFQSGKEVISVDEIEVIQEDCGSSSNQRCIGD